MEITSQIWSNCAITSPGLTNLKKIDKIIFNEKKPSILFRDTFDNVSMECDILNHGTLSPM